MSPEWKETMKKKKKKKNSSTIGFHRFFFLGQDQVIFSFVSLFINLPGQGHVKIVSVMIHRSEQDQTAHYFAKQDLKLPFNLHL